MNFGEQTMLDDILERIEGEDGPDTRAFISVPQTELRDYIGNAGFRRYVLTQHAVGKPTNKLFWRNLLYFSMLGPDVNPDHSARLPESRAVIKQIRQQMMNEIVRVLRQDVLDALNTIKEALGYGEEMCNSLDELLEEYGALNRRPQNPTNRRIIIG